MLVRTRAGARDRTRWRITNRASAPRRVAQRIWEHNGMQLSAQYSGASSNKAKYTNRASFLSNLVDAAHTNAQRLYGSRRPPMLSREARMLIRGILCARGTLRIAANTFLDGSRQAAIDAVLGVRASDADGGGD